MSRMRIVQVKQLPQPRKFHINSCGDLALVGDMLLFLTTSTVLVHSVSFLRWNRVTPECCAVSYTHLTLPTNREV